MLSEVSEAQKGRQVPHVLICRRKKFDHRSREQRSLEAKRGEQGEGNRERLYNGYPNTVRGEEVVLMSYSTIEL
jgi:hypothetical protein